MRSWPPRGVLLPGYPWDLGSVRGVSTAGSASGSINGWAEMAATPPSRYATGARLCASRCASVACCRQYRTEVKRRRQRGIPKVISITSLAEPLRKPPAERRGRGRGGAVAMTMVIPIPPRPRVSITLFLKRFLPVRGFGISIALVITLMAMLFVDAQP